MDRQIDGYTHTYVDGQTGTLSVRNLHAKLLLSPWKQQLMESDGYGFEF